MSIIVYGVFGSTDAAEFAATRLKRMVRGIRVTGLARRVMPDKSEENTYFAFPGINTLSSNIGGVGFNAAVPGGVTAHSGNEKFYEPSEREDVRLRVEADDRKAASAASSIMRSMGGLEIHQVSQ